MKKKAVIDRFEDNYAILLVDDEPISVNRTELPAGVKEGDWLLVEFQGKRLSGAWVDENQKAAMEARIADKLARLRMRGKK